LWFFFAQNGTKTHERLSILCHNPGTGTQNTAETKLLQENPPTAENQGKNNTPASI
jgi:hypothetical protein